MELACVSASEISLILETVAVNLRLLSTYHLLDKQIKLKRIDSSFPHSTVSISPEDHAQIQQYVEAIAAILLRKTSPKKLETPEGIEEALRRQTRQSIFPKLVIHLLKKQLKKQMSAHQMQISGHRLPPRQGGLRG